VDTSNRETITAASIDSVPLQSTLYRLDGIAGEFGMHDADAWLANMADNEIDELERQARGFVDVVREPSQVNNNNGRSRA
jgi:hypothetical protein